MNQVSEYRLRLFLSVDLAGSTAFKAGAGRYSAGANSPHPLWIVVIRKFYEAFPSVLTDEYNRWRLQKEAGLDGADAPQAWKTIGDEIIFCCRLQNSHHMHICLLSFIDALKKYGRTLVADGYQLDVKGTAWVAAFPAINMTATSTRRKKLDYLQEDFELNADKSPKEYDFLGPEIDAGFRIAKHSSPDKCAISLQLAWLLTRKPVSRWSPESFLYLGRDHMKGVINDRPYPVVCLITERQESKSELRRKEARITGAAYYNVSELHGFLSDFMSSEGIELPVLMSDDVSAPVEDMPASFKEFQVQAGSELKGIIEQENQLSQSGEAEDEPSEEGEMPTEITERAITYGKSQVNESL